MTAARLEIAVLPELAPGENLKDRASGATWTYALPDRRPGRIVRVGEASAATLEVLRTIGTELVVVPGGGSADRWPVADRSVGLVDAGDVDWSVGDRGDRLVAEIDRVLAPDGMAFIGLGSHGGGGAPTSLPSGVTDGGVLWLGRRAGEIRAVAPIGDRELIDHVTARWNADRAARSRLRRLLRSIGPGRERGPDAGSGVLRLPPDAGGVGQPPRYLRDLASAAGQPIDGHRWAILDPGSYGTKKILVFLVGPGGSAPDLVVKLVRDERFNPRLERAWQALDGLGRHHPELARLGPKPVFFGRHAGLAVMAESIVDGDPLKSRLSGEPDDPLIATVVDRFVTLGIATADATVAAPAEIAAELRTMVSRYVAIYGPTQAEQDGLAAAVERVTAAKGPIPLVLQHGDAGAWNVIVDRTAEPVLIDWEAAVPHGMPLWDVFYFVRSAAALVARQTGSRDALTGIDRTIIRGGPLAELIADAADRTCTATGLARDLIEPLFVLCWMHRAVKASTTLSTDRLARGHYRRLVAMSMERRAAPGLRRIFEG